MQTAPEFISILGRKQNLRGAFRHSGGEKTISGLLYYMLPLIAEQSVPLGAGVPGLQVLSIMLVV
jgi:hypothetical protein